MLFLVSFIRQTPVLWSLDGRQSVKVFFVISKSSLARSTICFIFWCHEPLPSASRIGWEKKENFCPSSFSSWGCFLEPQLLPPRPGDEIRHLPLTLLADVNPFFLYFPSLPNLPVGAGERISHLTRLQRHWGNALLVLLPARRIFVKEWNLWDTVNI